MRPQQTVSVFLVTILAAGCVHGTGVVLPPIEGVDEIRLKSDELGELIVTDADTINAVLHFANRFRSGWGVPWYGSPVTELHLEFYSKSKFTADFGISRNFVTRTYGNYWSRPVQSERVQNFAAATHPAILEAVFLTIPEGAEAQRVLEYWKSVLDELEPGTSWAGIAAFLERHSIRISYVCNDCSNLGYWRNLELQVVYEGAYVDTAVSAQLVLNSDLSLKKVRFFGYEHAKHMRAG